MTETSELKKRLARVESLIREAEKLADPQVRGQIQELVAFLLEFHGEALAKMVGDVADLGVPGHVLIDAWTRDELASSLLLLYDLHPVDTESRVLAALEQVRPFMQSHGGNVEYLGLVDGVVHLRLEGHCHSCPSSTLTLRLRVEKAIYEAAPDVAGIETRRTRCRAGGQRQRRRIQPGRRPQGCHMIENVSSTVAIAEASEDQRSPLAVLRRFGRVKTAGKVVEKCELCFARLPPEHQHLVDLRTRRLVCCCLPCGLLFSGRQSAQYRRVPLDVKSLPDFRLSDAQWESLLVPINLAFFYSPEEQGSDKGASPARKVIAVYPSPAGPVESLLGLEAWQEIVADNPLLRDLQPEVEALLVNRLSGKHLYYIVPIDECYRLSGLVRLHWRGLSGGSEVWDAVGQYFDRLKEKSCSI